MLSKTNMAIHESRIALLSGTNIKQDLPFQMYLPSQSPLYMLQIKKKQLNST